MSRQLFLLISVTLQFAVLCLPGGGIAILAWYVIRHRQKKTDAVAEAEGDQTETDASDRS